MSIDTDKDVGSYIVQAKVGPSFLTKADRLFRNDDTGIFTELLQNSRRAGATLVKVTIEAGPDAGANIVTVEDNGSGIEDFNKLLVLSESAWSPETKAAEDPAGMGFYSLCLSGVEVYSRGQYANFPPEAFTGHQSVVVNVTGEPFEGTRMRFTRFSTRQTLQHAITEAARFYPVDVSLDGVLLPRFDFLEGSIYREVIDGVEVGFAVEFSTDFSYYGCDANWNFYGARIREDFPTVRAVVPPENYRWQEGFFLHARFNVLETGRIKLQLPDRRAVIQSDFLKQFKVKAKAAAYRACQTLPQHLLSYEDWKEAASLGVILPEAAMRLTTWRALAHNKDGSQMFGEEESRTLAGTRQVLLVREDIEHVHTLQGALNSGAVVEYSLYREDEAFRGYTWYDSLPRLTHAELVVDGRATSNQELFQNEGERPSKIELCLTIEEPDETHTVVLPVLLHVDSEDYSAERFIAVKNSPWDEGAPGPFDLIEFLVYSTFSPSDDNDSDSYDTQLEYAQENARDLTRDYFCGPEASLVGFIKDWADSKYLSSSCHRLGVSQVLLHVQANAPVQVELIRPEPPVEVEPPPIAEQSQTAQ